MMHYLANITVMPLKELLDPQGKAVTGSLHQLGLQDIGNVRIGKNITLTVTAASEEAAREKVTIACEKLLCNAVMETFEIKLAPLTETA